MVLEQVVERRASRTWGRARLLCCWWALGVLLGAPLPCGADSIFLNEEGQKNLNLLRLRVAPAPIFEHPQQKLPYIRCIIVGERPGRNTSAPYRSIEGSAEYDIIAFDASGDQRSGTVTISDAWINHIESDFDSDLDVRGMFSDRDERAGVALGSRAYFAMARRAGDPRGTLGLWRGDMQLPPEPAGVAEGAVVKFLQDPPVNDADGLPTKWNARRREAYMARVKQALAERLPRAHLPLPEISPDSLVNGLVDAVARERAYRLSRAGFDRTALGMLVFILDLANVAEGNQFDGTNPAHVIALEGRNVATGLVEIVMAATPTSPAHSDPRELVNLMHRYRAAKNPAEQQQLAAQYDALQARVTSGRGSTCFLHAQFCIDDSQRAEVAIDALLASEALYTTNYHRLLADALVEIPTTPPGPQPHKHDRVNLRDSAMRLLSRTLKPPASGDAAVESRRQAFAKSMRAELRAIITDDRTMEAKYVIGRDALAAAGWGSAEELSTLVTDLFRWALSRAGDVSRSRDAAAGQDVRRDWAARHIAILQAVAGLAGSKVEHERRIATGILQRVAEMRKLQNTDDAQKVFLEIWDNLATPKRAR